ncbi:MAG TPA: ABC transporter permease [bacterium]|nr:ABC transporter permease [bacterium]
MTRARGRAPGDPAAAAVGAAPRDVGRGRAWRRFWRSRLAVPCAVVVALAIAAALGAPYIAPGNPVRGDLSDALLPPSPAHWFGTDDLGRDEVARLIYGARVSLVAGMISVGIAAAVGVPLGLAAGFAGGLPDEAIMRAVDAILAFPALVLALAISAALGPGLVSSMLAIGFVTIPAFARLTRGQVLAIRHLDFVESARAVGAGALRLLVGHVLPNALSPLVVQASLSVAFAILTEAGLSFLGLGVQPPIPSWGSMLLTGKNYLTTAPWLSLVPGAAIFLTVVSFNLLGDALDDALDPRRTAGSERST